MQEEVVACRPDESVILTEIDARVKALLAEMDVQENLVDAVTNFAIARDREAALKLAMSLEALRVLTPSVTGFPTVTTGGRGKAFDASLQGILNAVDVAFERIRDLDQRVTLVASDSVHPGVVRSAAEIRAVLKSLFDRIEEVRWQVLEEQAEADLASGRVKSFKNAASAKAFLHSSLKG